MNSDPAHTILAAADKLRTLTDAIRAPGLNTQTWHTERCADESLNECPCIVAHGISSGGGGPQTPVFYVADAETPECAAYITAMNPAVASSVINWLTVAGKQHSADPYALATAREILKETPAEILMSEGEAQATCPRKEVDPNPCRCTCQGCRHNCGAHHPGGNPGLCETCGAPWSRNHTCITPDELATQRSMLIEMMHSASESRWAAGWIEGLDRRLHAEGGPWRTIARTIGWPTGLWGSQTWMTWEDAAALYANNKIGT